MFVLLVRLWHPNPTYGVDPLYQQYIPRPDGRIVVLYNY